MARPTTGRAERRAERRRRHGIFSRWFPGFLERRLPRGRRVTLDQRRIFIAPSAAGGWFLLTLLLMFLVAVNYQNNLAFALVFLLISLFAVAILHTYANLAGLSLEGRHGHPTFAGERAEFEIQLSHDGARPRHHLTLGWPGEAPITVSLDDTTALPVRLFHATECRGVLRPGRLRLQSVYPLGLLRAWTWLDLDLSTLVYPQPLSGSRPLATIAASQQPGSEQSQPGSDDYAGFRPYRAGDAPRQVLWRTAAKGLPLQTKQFAETRLPTEHLSFAAASGDTELRLRLLCHWVLAASRQQQPFGLELPGFTLAPGSGPEHTAQALTALARFGLTEPPA